MSDTPLWPCGVRAIVVADTLREAERIIRDHPEFFKCRRGYPAAPRSHAHRGLRADALWIASSDAYEQMKNTLWPCLMTVAGEPLIHRGG